MVPYPGARYESPEELTLEQMSAELTRQVHAVRIQQRGAKNSMNRGPKPDFGDLTCG